MKVLHLLRHAKSAWDLPDVPDHDRPLSPRGARAATLMGRHLRQCGFRTDLILCSSARRADDTLALVLAQLGSPDILVERERELYLVGDRILLERVRRLPDACGSVLLVGHNPDLQNLALALADPKLHGPLEQVAGKFPTAGFATLSFPVDSWRDVAPASGHLQEFVIPKRLS